MIAYKQWHASRAEKISGLTDAGTLGIVDLYSIDINTQIFVLRFVNSVEQ